MSTPSKAKDQAIRFVTERILLPVPQPAIFLPQPVQVSVGLTQPDGGEVWYSNAEDLGLALANDVDFQAIRLGTWLNTPDGSLIAEVVKQLIPPEYRPEYQLVVDAFTLAADKQRLAGWQRAGLVGVGIGVAVIAVVLQLGGDP